MASMDEYGHAPLTGYSDDMTMILHPVPTSFSIQNAGSTITTD